MKRWEWQKNEGIHNTRIHQKSKKERESKNSEMQGRFLWPVIGSGMTNGQRYAVVKVIPQNHNKSVPFNGLDKTVETSIIGSYYLVTDKPSTSY